MVFDAQIPVLLSPHPVAFELLGRDVGLPWFAVPLAVIAGLVVPTVMALSSLRAEGAAS